MINDLTIRNASLRIFVDDTATSEVVKKGQQSKAQITAKEVVDWSTKNRFQVNSEKCKELRISFTSASEFPPVIIGQKCIKLVEDAKLLGVTISSDLTWNAHVSEVTKKAATRLYFLQQLKRARVPQKDLCLFYITCVRSVIDYAAPRFHHALPAYLLQELERLQKRAMRIICPGIEYLQALALMSLPTVAEHHYNICKRTFVCIMNNPNHKLRKLLPPLHSSKYDLRHAQKFTLPRCKTNRFKNSFIMASSRNVNNF